jgi:DnaJ-class molecular chaperone
MVLYEMLGLHDWNVSKRTIMTAWRQTAIMAHPDKVPEDEREAATTLMQQVNAAAEVLSHRATRRQYHIDGVLPWAVWGPIVVQELDKKSDVEDK